MFNRLIKNILDKIIYILKNKYFLIFISSLIILVISIINEQYINKNHYYTYKNKIEINQDRKNKEKKEEIIVHTLSKHSNEKTTKEMSSTNELKLNSAHELIQIKTISKETKIENQISKENNIENKENVNKSWSIIIENQENKKYIDNNINSWTLIYWENIEIQNEEDYNDILVIKNNTWNTTIENDLLKNTNFNSWETTEIYSTWNISLESINNSWSIIKENNEPVSNFLNKKIKTYIENLNDDVFNWFKIKVIKDNVLILENWIWYTYIFKDYHNFWKWVIPKEEDLKINWLDKNKTVLLLDDKIWASYVTEYEKVKLISDDIISDISNKYNFLLELSDDKKYSNIDTDESFLELKNKTLELTNWLTQYNKIKKVYDYILKNISYSKVFDIENKYIFSWISTYEKKEWVCSWYSKLNLYMLSFAWINWVKVVKWHVIDATDFPDIWHAWLKIWNNYYDSTFDDTWNNWLTKEFEEYKYFWLPKDLFYTNRFDYWELPLELRSADLEYRKEYVKLELEKLKEKYINKNFKLLK